MDRPRLADGSSSPWAHGYFTAEPATCHGEVGNDHLVLIRRLRGPAFLILLGVTALLNQWGVLSFSRSWPSI